MLTVTAPEVNVHTSIPKMEPCSSWVTEPGSGLLLIFITTRIQEGSERNTYHHHFQISFFPSS